MAASIDPFSQAGDLLLNAEQGPDDTTARVPYHPDFWMEHAMREIYDRYGDVVEVKPKSLLKFGSYASLGTSFETVQSHGGTETYQTSNTINTVSSTDAADTTLVAIEGLTIDGSGNFTSVSQTATLNGQNKVVLTTPLARCTRAYNTNGNAWAGNVYIYEDDTVTAGVPDTATKIHALALAVDQQTEKAATTISNADYWIVTQAFAAVNKKTAAVVDFKLQFREKGGVFRTQFDMTLNNTSGGRMFEFKPYLIVPQNSDVRTIAAASTSSVSVSAGVNGPLATVKVDN
jgi:hypothetical protein